jgi:type I restriction enzyme S subunit
MRESWVIKKLGEICNFQGGSQPPKSEFISEYREKYVRFLQIRDFKSDKYIVYIPISAKNRLCNETDILIGRYGASVGQILRGKSGAYNVALIKTIPDENIVNSNFLFFYLNSSLFQKPLILVSDRSAQSGFSKEDISPFEIPIPPLPEQKRIVAILDEAFEGIDRAISNTEKNLSNTRELFESYLNSIFSQKGEGWEEKKLREIGGKVFTGPFGSLLHKSDYVSNGIPIVNPANIEDEKIIPNFSKTISPDTVKRLQSYVLTTNDVVVARRGEIGRCAVVTEEQSGWLCGSGSFFIKPFENVNSVFLAHLLRSAVYRSQLEKLSTGATMQNLSNQSLSDLVIAMPSLDEQNQITNKTDDLKSEIQHFENIYRQKIAALKELKQSILQKAFTGELTADKGITAMEEKAA